MHPFLNSNSCHFFCLINLVLVLFFFFFPLPESLKRNMKQELVPRRTPLDVIGNLPQPNTFHSALL